MYFLKYQNYPIVSSISGISGSGSSFIGSRVNKSKDEVVIGGWVRGTESEDEVVIGGWVRGTESEDEVVIGGWVRGTESEDEVVIGGWVRGTESEEVFDDTCSGEVWLCCWTDEWRVFYPLPSLGLVDRLRSSFADELVTAGLWTSGADWFSFDAGWVSIYSLSHLIIFHLLLLSVLFPVVFDDEESVAIPSFAWYYLEILESFLRIILRYFGSILRCWIFIWTCSF